MRDAGSALKVGGQIILGVPLMLLLAAPLITLIVALPDLAWLGGEQTNEAWRALELSVMSSALTIVLTILLGTPIAWWLAHGDSKVTRIFALVITTPILLPPSIVGLTLLEFFSRGGWVAQLIPAASLIPFSYAAVVIAQLVVSAPLYVLGAASAFRQYSPELIEVARCLGATSNQAWRHVTLPLVIPGLAMAIALAGARSIGEFGATLLLAGNLSGLTQTAPLAIYLELERGTSGALAISLGLLFYALPLLGGITYLGRKVRS